MRLPPPAAVPLLGSRFGRVGLRLPEERAEAFLGVGTEVPRTGIAGNADLV